ncbi:phage tail tape measure protein [Clostridium perfringens]|uniref:phage tail tape measure protein n=1 Tax=Clostridium perfringens TaxID=1502 RepID=UPI0013E35841|nr:phage tail tape measure protein [Clostridium perfringens]NGS95824.1 phage tail tape measure protein [Clostridium perfringens]
MKVTECKSISMNLAKMKNTVDGIKPKLKSMIKEVTGVNITDINGQMRSTYDIMVDISKVWDKLTVNQKVTIIKI